MRQKLNENRTAQIALVAMLVIAVGYLLTSSFGGSSSGAAAAAGKPAAESTEAATGTVEAAAGTVEATPASATSGVTAPAGRPLPKAVDAAYEQGRTIALLVYRAGGIDDQKVAEASSVLAGMANVAYFSVSVNHVAKYSAITAPLGVSGAPALIVVRPRSLNGGGPAPATVTYGFQSSADIEQAVRDAGYHGPDLTYAPN